MSHIQQSNDGMSQDQQSSTTHNAKTAQSGPKQKPQKRYTYTSPNTGQDLKDGAIPPKKTTRESKLGPVKSKQGHKPPKATREGKLGPVKAKNRAITTAHQKTPVQENTDLTNQVLSPVEKGKKPDPNKYWNFKEFKEAYAEKVDESELTLKEKAYFDNYAKQAQFYLERPNTKWKSKTPLNGKMFAEAAKRMYLRYGKDMSKVVPLEMALSQAQFESHFGLVGRSAEKNPFNIGEYNTSTAGFVKEIEDAPMGVATYYHLMAEDYLSTKKPEQLLQNFTNEQGNRYQVNDNGVVDHAYEKKLRSQIRYIQQILKQMPGGYTPTFHPPVVTNQTTVHKPKVSKITHVPLPKSKNGFSVGMPGGKYIATIINFPEDVRRIQQKLLEVGLLSEADYAKEYPQAEKAPAKKPSYKEVQSLTPKGSESTQNQEKNLIEIQEQARQAQRKQQLLDWLRQLSEQEVRAITDDPVLNPPFYELLAQFGIGNLSSQAEMITQLMVLRGQNVKPLSKQKISTPETTTPPEVPYVHYLTDFEQAAMNAYGKVPVSDRIPVTQLTKTIAAIEVFQREVMNGFVDARIDPDGETIGVLMNSTVESVAQSRKTYVEKQKQEEEDDFNIEEILSELGTEIKEKFLELMGSIADRIMIILKTW